LRCGCITQRSSNTIFASSFFFRLLTLRSVIGASSLLVFRVLPVSFVFRVVAIPFLLWVGKSIKDSKINPGAIPVCRADVPGEGAATAKHESDARDHAALHRGTRHAMKSFELYVLLVENKASRAT
jgi:hypothetical protein